MSIRIDSAVYSFIGRRSNNEDNFFLNEVYMEREQMDRGGKLRRNCSEPWQIYAVCDGMGGAEFGEEASLLAVRSLLGYKKTCMQPDNMDNLLHLVNKISRDINQIALSRNMPVGASGSTLAMMVIHDWYFRVVHIGDSRVYRLRDGRLERLTKDHSEVQLMVDAGQITPDEAWLHPRRNVITRHLGMPTDDNGVHPEISARMELKSGDRYIICSDGLNDSAHDSVIEHFMKLQEDNIDILSQLVQFVMRECDKKRVDSDNITIIMLDVANVGDRNADKKRIRRLNVARVFAMLMTVIFGGGLAYSLTLLIKFILR